MARVSFTTAKGEKVEFQASGKRARGQTRPLSDYNKFMSRRILYHMGTHDMDNVAAFTAAVKDWNMNKQAGTVIQQQRARQNAGAVLLNQILGNLPVKAKKAATVKLAKQHPGSDEVSQQQRARQTQGSVMLSRILKVVTKQQEPVKRQSRDPLAQLAARRRRAS